MTSSGASCTGEEIFASAQLIEVSVIQRPFIYPFLNTVELILCKRFLSKGHAGLNAAIKTLHEQAVVAGARNDKSRLMIHEAIVRRRDEVQSSLRGTTGMTA